MVRPRGSLFADVDEVHASGVLVDVLKEHKILLGGSSLGKGLEYAAQYYLSRLATLSEGRDDLNGDIHTITPLEDEGLLEESCQHLPEESFYVVDIGVVVSQVFQWRKHFERVESFYAVKANPDPVIVRTLAIMGCNFDCASRNEVELVLEQSRNLSRTPEIIFANPCKARAHADAVRRGVRLMTFDNAPEVAKCATISKKIELVLRIITDDRGSQCRLSSKFGAPQHKWRSLLQAVKDCGLQCVGVSFHVGSGCCDATRYKAALHDAREVFDMAEREFGFHMTLLDIGGGFPGETHSTWNPIEFIDDSIHDASEGLGVSSARSATPEDDHFLFFTEIAQQVGPIIDDLFPENHVRVIAEPGRYFVAAAATLVTAVIGARDNNAVDNTFLPESIDDQTAASYLDQMTRDDESHTVRKRGISFSENAEKSKLLDSFVEEIGDYTKLFAKQNLVQQEADVYNDALDLYHEDFDSYCS